MTSDTRAGSAGTGRVRVGVVGTSWWADAMYLPALSRHPLADVRAVAGARPDRTREFARRWSIPAVYDDAAAMLAREPLDAVVVVVPNREHLAIAMMAIERGLHVLCEKPLGLSSSEARAMTDAADRAGLITMTPFTYRAMPSSRYVKELLDEGYLGRPYHLNLRYYAGYGRSGDYLWRFDEAVAGPLGTGGDLGSHWIDLGRWFFGEIDAVSAVVGRVVPRAPRPDGSAYDALDDSALFLLEFAGGAIGSVQVSAVAHEPSEFGQRHALELHGSAGTIHVVNDWNATERVSGARADETAIHDLPIPDRILAGARRDTVVHTYKDTFRDHDHLARGFISAIAAGTPASPDFRDGLAVQRVLDAAALSVEGGRRVTIAEIVAGEDPGGAVLPGPSAT